MGGVVSLSYPDQPTLAEQFISALRLPYSVSCALVAFLLGPPSQIFWAYLVTLDLSRAFDRWLSIVLAVTGYIGYVAYLLTIAYTFYAVRYVRMKLLKIEGTLSELLPNGERDFHGFFGGVSARKWQIVAWALLFVSVLWFNLRIYPESGATVQGLVELTIALLIGSLGVASALWVFLSSLRGIHRMGLASLQLRSYQVDRHLGLRPIGSLALSLSFIYFGAMLLNGLNNITRVTSDIIYFTILSGFVAIGLLMFFLPMLRFHNVMIRFKHQERERLRQRQEAFLKERTGVDPAQVNVDMLFLDMMERKVSSISTWPFDTQMLGKLFAVVSSVLGMLLSLLSVF